MKRTLALILALVMTMALVACGGDKPTSTPSTPSNPATSTPATPGTDKPAEPAVDPEAGRYGGELIMCSGNATSTQDVHQGMGSLGNQRWMLHIYENLAVNNIDGKTYSQTCDFEQSADGLTMKFTLRDCCFSNGEKVTMDDVWASIYRAAGTETSSSWDKLWKGTSIQKDDKSITFTFEKTNINFLSSFCSVNSRYKIMPKEICDKYPVTGGELQANGLIRGGEANHVNQEADGIGTGPYKLESYSEVAIAMVRNDKYTQVENGATEGPAAPKKAYADKITIAINREASSRSAAMLAGEYDSSTVSNDMADAVVAAGMQKLNTNATWTHAIFFNLDESNSDSPIYNVNVRKAIRAVLDANALLLSISRDEKANVLEPYPMMVTTAYHNTILSDGEWNIQNEELAKEYLKKANYNGEPIKYLSTPSGNTYNIAMAALPLMEKIGLNIELEVVDAGSYNSLRAKPETGHDIGALNSQKRDDNPVLQSTYVSGTTGWWSSPAKDAAMDKMKNNPTGSAASIEGYKDWCEAVADEVPFILLGHIINYVYAKPDIEWNIQGATEYYWNVYRK